MRENVVARRYARALFELAHEKGLLDRTADELRLLRELYRVVPEFRVVILSFRITPERKLSILEEMPGVDLSDLTRNFLRTLFENRREELLDPIGQVFERLIRGHLNVAEVSATTAEPLSGSVRDRLVAAVGSMLEKEISLESEIEPSLLGGMVLRVDNTIYDASVAGALKRMREEMAA